MNFFGRSKSRSPADTVRQLREQILKLEPTSSTDTRKRVSLLLLLSVATSRDMIWL